LKNNYLLLR